MQEQFYINKIAVLGAGVMGAQIAAHCVNAGIETLLYDIAAHEGPKNGIVNKAIDHLSTIKPSPLATHAMNRFIQPRNYDEHLSELASCCLIIEAISERMDLKQSLYEKISPYLNDHSILVSNTSGLSINCLARLLSPSMRTRFCGVHFFNPPRYMHLAELIPADATSPHLLDHLEDFLTRRLGKGVIRAKDTPNFIANRIGVFSMLITIYHAQQFNLGLDEVDALTGVLLGRSKSATFRTMDVVGLDTMQLVVSTMQQQLKDDPWHKMFVLPDWFNALIKEGHLGQKTQMGIYRKLGKIIEVYSPKAQGYHPSKGILANEIKEIMKQGDPIQRFHGLYQSANPQAKFLVACFIDLFHYSAYHLKDIARNVRDVDLAVRFGFGWREGPFESWQSSGFTEIYKIINQRIHNNQTISNISMPDWVSSINEFYNEQGAFSPEDKQYDAGSKLAIYDRQFFPPRVLLAPSFKPQIFYENEGVSLWGLKDDIAVVSFKSKSNTIGQAVLDGFYEAIDKAQTSCKGLIIYQHDANNFSSGADLSAVLSLIKNNQRAQLENMIDDFQYLALKLKYSPIPTIAALRGRALGGGCELMLHCSRVVASFEAYPGLVEVGVGLIPAGGGCKEMAQRASSAMISNELMPHIKNYFETIAQATVAASAIDAIRLGFLTSSDVWVMNQEEVLFGAIAQINALVAANYSPPLKALLKVAGREGHAMLEAGLVNWKEGGFISEHDYLIGNILASVLCGGDVNEGEYVDEAWMLRLEKNAFMSLVDTPLTIARMTSLLETGKPLRN
jgi:3-hydroxyacyl-CoA dehydrogenase